ncbi:MAG TPA: 5-(carboxyamino)imidazole ribonucleotide synthase [Longimicrobiales bacterium]
MRVGILGGGQLGRMLALAGYPLGLRFRFLDPSPDASGGQLAGLVIAAYDDAAAIDRFVEGLDVATYEFENVPAETAEHLGRHVPVLPPREALDTAQDRLVEKECFRALDIPTAPFAAIDERSDLDPAIERIGLPAVLKTRRLGYDGKGQRVLQDLDDVQRAWSDLGGVPLILEGFIDFDREVSIIAVRGRDGRVAFYPLIENQHRQGILRLSTAPAPGTDERLQALAERHAARVLDALDYVGILAIEFFQTGDRLVANEMAPRVHNSGHWTIEGAETSQFENHLRAICGFPLGSTAPRGHSIMFNLIGAAPDVNAVLAIRGAHLHLYAKEPRPGRKIGHITIRADDAETAAERLEQLRQAIG